MKIEDTKRIIIKIGSSLLFNSETKKHNKEWLISLAEDVNFLKNQNKDVIIVSSGAIAFGAKDLNLEMSELRLDIHQALAAIGQINLMSAFKNAFEKYESKVSQVLLTLDDTEKRRRSINARRTIDTLLKLGIVPVVNENDTIATSEIRYGDNDRLASRVAQITNADTLILLSDVDGLYTKNPKKFKDAQLIKRVSDLDKVIKSINIKGMTELGSGGMNTKIEAAKICNLAGCNMVIANGLNFNPINQIQNEGNCTWFISKISKMHARKKWIISSISPKGELIIDDGAKKALHSGKSLLAAGIKKVVGRFNKGDHIKILDNKKKEFARGLSSFSSKEINLIMGCHSNEIQKILGYVSKSEVVHKDDMVEI